MKAYPIYDSDIRLNESIQAHVAAVRTNGAHPDHDFTNQIACHCGERIERLPVSADTNGWRPIWTNEKPAREGHYWVKRDPDVKPYIRTIGWADRALIALGVRFVSTDWNFCHIPMPSPDLTPPARTPPAPEEGAKEERIAAIRDMFHRHNEAQKLEGRDLIVRGSFEAIRDLLAEIDHLENDLAIVERAAFNRSQPPTEISKEAREAAGDICANANWFGMKIATRIQSAIDTVAEPLRREVERLKKNIGCARNQGSTQFCADLQASRERCAELEAEVAEQQGHLFREALTSSNLQARTEQLTEALANLRHGKNGCFCDVSIGHPLVKSHTPQCLNAEAALK